MIVILVGELEKFVFKDTKVPYKILILSTNRAGHLGHCFT